MAHRLSAIAAAAGSCDAQAEYAVSFLSTRRRRSSAGRRSSARPQFPDQGAQYMVTTSHPRAIRRVPGRAALHHDGPVRVHDSPTCAPPTRRFGTIDYSEEPPCCSSAASSISRSSRCRAFGSMKDGSRHEPRPVKSRTASNAQIAAATSSCAASPTRDQPSACNAAPSSIRPRRSSQILQQFDEKMRVQAAHPARLARQMGRHAVGGHRLPVANHHVEGVAYSWHEYLLFNPYHGFRYLTLYNGHWSDVRPCTGSRVHDRRGPKRRVVYAVRSTSTFSTPRPNHVRDGRVSLGGASGRGNTGGRLRRRPADALVRADRRRDQLVARDVRRRQRHLAGVSICRARRRRSQGVYANQPSPYLGKVRGAWRHVSSAVRRLGRAAGVLRLLASNKQVVSQVVPLCRGHARRALASSPRLSNMQRPRQRRSADPNRSRTTTGPTSISRSSTRDGAGITTSAAR